uniref:Uncharacterized protein n=1 Tax=Meloidogyne enterolobii TaxID=390850 RepID=A0A6V7Y1T6_MELEN|nr:unnamed protein product [Meloidogyne enterolobii]CAD2205589.1 unnamed protein product [Meloidogyne enterolobii]
MGHHSRDRSSSSDSSRNESVERKSRGAEKDSRISRSYRSPPPRSGHKSRGSPKTTSSSCLSNFYKERFGSHSPEDYLNLRISQFDPKHDKDDIRYLLEKEFRHLAPFEIKIVRNPEDDERMAYVNFERPDCAKSVRRSLLPRLNKVLGRNIAIDPAGVIRDQEGKFVPDRYNRAVLASDSSAPIQRPIRRLSPPTHHHHYTNNLQQRRTIPKHLNQDDSQASRTLFVGNLPGNIRDSELRRIFDCYGTIDDVDIKTLADSNAAYAFLQFETVEGSIAARQGQHGKPIRPGGNRCQVGYGKSVPNLSLIVGGLGSWANSDLLDKEFGKFGDIEEIEYDDGASHAIIRFAESSAANEAWTSMKNQELVEDCGTITVDYAREDKKDSRSRKRLCDINNGSNNDLDSNNKRARVSTPSPSSSPTRAGHFENIEQLKEAVACTWKGVIQLKKLVYPLSLYRVFGREHLIQDILRDSSGVALRLTINQRLPVILDLYQKLVEYTRTQIAISIAVEREQTCEPLIKYLQEKNAAGVVTLEGAILYIFTNSPVAERLLKFFAPRALPLLLQEGSPHRLLLVLKINQTTSGGGGGQFLTTTTNQQQQASSLVSAPPPFPIIKTAPRKEIGE